MSCNLPHGSSPYVDEKEMEFLPTKLRDFPVSAQVDCCYNTYLVASDGRLYMGTCRQGGSAHLLAYDPVMDKIIDLANMDDVVPGPAHGYVGQGKIHSQLCEGVDGKIYGATHMDILFPSWSSFYDAHGYAGGHWFYYDPKTNRCVDLGLAIKNEGILTMAMDRERQILYGLSWPRGYLLSYDIRTGITKNLGRASIHLSRYMVCLRDGTVYLTGRNGHMAYYRPGMRSVENTSLKLHRRMGELYTADIGKDTTFTACIELEPARSFLAFIFRTGDAFIYNQATGAIRYYELFNQGFYFNMQPVMASDKKVYYALGPDTPGVPANQSARLFRLDPQTGANELCGYFRDTPADKLRHITGGAIGPDDTTYWFGLSSVSPDDPVTEVMNRSDSTSYFYNTIPKLIICRPRL